jgi:hypothetical protein
MVGMMDIPRWKMIAPRRSRRVIYNPFMGFNVKELYAPTWDAYTL